LLESNNSIRNSGYGGGKDSGDLAGVAKKAEESRTRYVRNSIDIPKIVTPKDCHYVQKRLDVYWSSKNQGRRGNEGDRGRGRHAFCTGLERHAGRSPS
jgi:hypothetical protein